jgi:hypothetical protein
MCHTCRKYGGLQTTLRIEWYGGGLLCRACPVLNTIGSLSPFRRDFVVDPQNEARLLTECERFGLEVGWPNAKGVSRITGKAHPSRKPAPLNHYLDHCIAKLANLNRAEVPLPCAGEEGGRAECGVFCSICDESFCLK